MEKAASLNFQILYWWTLMRLLCSMCCWVSGAKLMFSWLNCFSAITGCLVTYSSIMLSIQGAGTAIGELPPYFMARAGNKWQCLVCRGKKNITQCVMRNLWMTNFSLAQSFRAKFSAGPLSHGSTLHHDGRHSCIRNLTYNTWCFAKQVTDSKVAYYFQSKFYKKFHLKNLPVDLYWYFPQHDCLALIQMTRSLKKLKNWRG